MPLILCYSCPCWRADGITEDEVVTEKRLSNKLHCWIAFFVCSASAGEGRATCGNVTMDPRWTRDRPAIDPRKFGVGKLCFVAGS